MGKNRRNMMRFDVVICYSAETPPCPVEVFRRRPGVSYRQTGLSNLQQTPAHGNRYRVSPVIRSELVHQILDMKIDGCLGNR